MQGIHGKGEKKGDATYDVSLAETWDEAERGGGEPKRRLRSFTGRRIRNGNACSYSVLTATPGLRFTVAKRNVFMVGVDFPLRIPTDMREVYRWTYIYNF